MTATPPSACTPWPASSPRPQQLLPQAIYDARDQELTWAQIGELHHPANASRRYRSKP
jgi:hypothetical protein